MKKIPTTEEFYYKYKESNINISKIQFKNAMTECTKMHVEAALTNIHKCLGLPPEELDIILHSYPPENIK